MSPLSDYFKGKGRKVMSDMKDRYGEKAGERVFHATANARGMTPSDDQPKRKTFGQRIAEKGQ